MGVIDLIRLIATDMDDTLLNADGAITPRTKAAVRRAIEAGAFFSLSSGRMPEALVSMAEDIGVNAPLISYNGALIYDYKTKKALYQHAIPASVARRVFEAFESLGVYAQGYSKNGIFCREKTDYTLFYEKAIRVTATAVHEPLSRWVCEDMTKLLAIDAPERLDELIPDLKARFPEIQFMKSRPYFLEMVLKGVDKGAAIRRLGEILNVKPEEIMAFGDGQNDLPMIETAGIGCAMENAVDDLKRVAQVIAPKNTEDGVAQVLERFLDEGRIGG